MPATTEPRFVDANGLRFAYLEEGTGPLVLLLHGFPDTAQTWDAVRPALARAGFRAVSPFMRGYAPTAVPADRAYDTETLGRDALALIEALGAERAIVVGHDWGAAAAYAAASLAPERVARLITVGIPHPAALPRFAPRVLWGARHFIKFQFRGAEAKVRADDFAYVDELWRRWSPGWQVPPGETLAVKEAFRQPGCLEAALGYYRAVSGTVPASLRRRITVPSWVFSPERDGILRRSDYDRARGRFEAPHQIVDVPGGHFCHRQHPERFIPELVNVVAA